MKPATRRKAAMVMLALDLSFLAIAITALDLLATTDARKALDDG